MLSSRNKGNTALSSPLDARGEGHRLRFSKTSQLVHLGKEPLTRKVNPSHHQSGWLHLNKPWNLKGKELCMDIFSLT